MTKHFTALLLALAISSSIAISGPQAQEWLEAGIKAQEFADDKAWSRATKAIERAMSKYRKEDDFDGGIYAELVEEAFRYHGYADNDAAMGATLRNGIKFIRKKAGADQVELIELYRLLAQYYLNYRQNRKAIKALHTSLEVADAAYGPGTLEAALVKYEFYDWLSRTRLFNYNAILSGFNEARRDAFPGDFKLTFYDALYRARLAMQFSQNNTAEGHFNRAIAELDKLEGLKFVDISRGRYALWRDLVGFYATVGFAKEKNQYMRQLADQGFILEGYPLRRVSPKYEMKADTPGYWGFATIDIDVGTDGRPLRVEITNSSGNADYTQAIAEAVTKWQLLVQFENGEPVPYEIRGREYSFLSPRVARVGTYVDNQRVYRASRASRLGVSTPDGNKYGGALENR